VRYPRRNNAIVTTVAMRYVVRFLWEDSFIKGLEWRGRLGALKQYLPRKHKSVTFEEWKSLFWN